jgi:colicin import membrane protein
MNAVLAMRPPEPGKGISVVLAIAVHLVLAALLIYGVRWQTKVNDVVEVELVRSLPPLEATPQVKPEVVPEPKPEPRPQPKVEVKPPPKPDIAIKTKEKPRPPKEVPKKEEPRPRMDFSQQLKSEESTRELNRQLADEDRRANERRAAAAQAQRKTGEAGYADRIRGKIRGNIVLPPDLRGNPMAVFDVVQLPSGEVISARLTKSSGHPGYDAAVERAILKSSPLPKADDPSLFQRDLKLNFCPQEDGKCG